MKKIINDPAQYTDDMLQGIYRAHGEQVGYVNGDLRCYCTKKKVPGKVAIITGGGTGHLPLFLGYVGEGLPAGRGAGGAGVEQLAAGNLQFRHQFFSCFSVFLAGVEFMSGHT